MNTFTNTGTDGNEDDETHLALTSEQYVQRVLHLLRSDGVALENASVGGKDVVIGRFSKFRLRWVASRMHFFIFVVDFSASGVGQAVADDFMAAAVDYAIDHKGGLPRGSQTGTYSVAIVITEDATSGLVRWASEQRRSRFGAGGFPVLVDTKAQTVVWPKPAFLGRAYYSSLVQLVRKFAVGGLSLE